MEASGEAYELDLLRLEPQLLGDDGGQLSDDEGVPARVGVPRVHGMREARGRPEPGLAVGHVRQPRDVGQVREVRAVDLHDALPGALGEVERLVGDREDLRAVDSDLRVRDDAGGDADGDPGHGLEHRHAREHTVRHLLRLALVTSRKEDGELVSSDPEGLSVLT